MCDTLHAASNQSCVAFGFCVERFRSGFLFYVSGLRFCAQCAGDSLCEDSVASLGVLIVAGGFFLDSGS